MSYYTSKCGTNQWGLFPSNFSLQKNSYPVTASGRGLQGGSAGYSPQRRNCGAVNFKEKKSNN